MAVEKLQYPQIFNSFCAYHSNDTAVKCGDSSSPTPCGLAKYTQQLHRHLTHLSQADSNKLLLLIIICQNVYSTVLQMCHMVRTDKY